MLAPLDATLKPTSFAGDVTAFEKWVDKSTGIDLALPMLKTAPAWSLFQDGIAFSLILIAGALVATLGFAVLLGAAMGSRSALLRWPARAITMTMQSSPIVLTLVIAMAIAHALFALSTAVIPARRSRRWVGQRGQCRRPFPRRCGVWCRGSAAPRLFGDALSRSATQIVAFLVNAAKGTPVRASSAPEL